MQELAEKLDMAAFKSDPGHVQFLAFKTQLVSVTKVVRDFFNSLAVLFEADDGEPRRQGTKRPRS